MPTSWPHRRVCALCCPRSPARCHINRIPPELLALALDSLVAVPSPFGFETGFHHTAYSDRVAALRVVQTVCRGWATAVSVLLPACMATYDVRLSGMRDALAVRPSSRSAVRSLAFGRLHGEGDGCGDVVRAIIALCPALENLVMACRPDRMFRFALPPSIRCVVVAGDLPPLVSGSTRPETLSSWTGSNGALSKSAMDAYDEYRPAVRRLAISARHVPAALLSGDESNAALRVLLVDLDHDSVAGPWASQLALRAPGVETMTWRWTGTEHDADQLRGDGAGVTRPMAWIGDVVAALPSAVAQLAFVFKFWRGNERWPTRSMIAILDVLSSAIATYPPRRLQRINIELMDSSDDSAADGSSTLRDCVADAMNRLHAACRPHGVTLAFGLVMDPRAEWPDREDPEFLF